MLFLDCFLNSFVRKRENLIGFIDNKHAREIGFRFYQARFDGVSESVLGGLINDIKRFVSFHLMKSLAPAARRCQPQSQSRLAFAGVTLNDCDFSERDIRFSTASQPQAKEQPPC